MACTLLVAWSPISPTTPSGASLQSPHYGTLSQVTIHPNMTMMHKNSINQPLTSRSILELMSYIRILTDYPLVISEHEMQSERSRSAASIVGGKSKVFIHI